VCYPSFVSCLYCVLVIILNNKVIVYDRKRGTFTRMKHRGQHKAEVYLPDRLGYRGCDRNSGDKSHEMQCIGDNG
jgi:hypothetical protein